MLFINDAFAEAAPAVAGSSHGGMIQILTLVGFVIVFYFLLWRPQAKRAKEQRNLLASLAAGDEVTTTGGIVGKIIRINGDLVELKIAPTTEITVQKGAVTSVLPKGTLKTL